MGKRKIQLSDISTLPIYKQWKIDSEEYNTTGYYRVLNALEESEDYKSLKNANTKLKDDYISGIIKRAEERIQIANSHGAQPVIYTTNETLELANDYNQKEIDKKTNGRILLFGNPLEPTKERAKLEKYSIYELKQLMSHCKFNGKNALASNLGYIRPGYMEKLVRSINFYNEHVQRLSKEEPESYDKSTIMNNYELSDIRRLVYQQIREIVEYLVDNAEVCVTGVLSKWQKENMLLALEEICNYDRNAISNLVSSISNYVTYSEASEGIIKSKVIDRFIIK